LRRLCDPVLRGWLATSFSVTDATHVQSLRLAVQLLANACVQCEATQNAVWLACFPALFA
jgi:hypothetical protein